MSLYPLTSILMNFCNIEDYVARFGHDIDAEKN